MTDIKKQQSAKHIFVRSKIDSILNQHKARQSMSFYFSLNHIKPCKKQLQKTKNIKIQEDKQHCLRHILHHSIWKNLFNISTNCLGFSKEILFWFKFRQIHLLEFYTGVEFSIKFSTLSFAVDLKPILDSFVLSFNIERLESIYINFQLKNLNACKSTSPKQQETMLICKDMSEVTNE